MRFVDAVERFVEVALREPVRHAEVLVEVVSAVARGRTRDRVMEVADELKHTRDDGYDVAGAEIAGEDDIATGAAAHRSEVDGLPGPFRIVPEEGGPCYEVTVVKGEINFPESSWKY